MENTVFTIGQTIRTRSGKGRVTYQPDWSETQPWVSYYYGTAGLHFHNLTLAAQYFSKRYNDPLLITTNKETS